MNLFHRHGPWTVIGAFCDGYAHYISKVRQHTPVTNVALRCPCGCVKSKQLVGKFTLEQLKGEAAAVLDAIKYLEKM